MQRNDTKDYFTQVVLDFNIQKSKDIKYIIKGNKQQSSFATLCILNKFWFY